jgi:hypothetical protein
MIGIKIVYMISHNGRYFTRLPSFNLMKQRPWTHHLTLVTKMNTEALNHRKSLLSIKITKEISNISMVNGYIPNIHFLITPYRSVVV